MSNFTDFSRLFSAMNQRLRALETRQHPALILRFTNRSGVSIVSGDVVVLDPFNNKSIVLASPGLFAPGYVAVNNANTGDAIFCAGKGYGFIEIQCVGAAVLPGDLIVASQISPRFAEVDNAADPLDILGISIESKAAGIIALLSIEVR